MSGEPALLAVDLGGTTIKGAVVDAAGRVRAMRVAPTLAAGGPDAVLALIAVLELLSADAAARGLRVAGAGIVTPGIVDQGRVVFAANLGWRDLDLRDQIERRLGVPVALGHDVRAAAQAEALLGEARGARDFVMAVIGTGIAAALVSDGRELRGAGGATGELGHIPVVPDGEPCACGQFGCLETYASASAIARRFHAMGGARIDSEQVGARLGSDPLADRVWGEAVRALSLGLAAITLLLDPAVIVLGGGLSRAGGTLLDPLRLDLAGRLAWRPAPPLVQSALGAAAGRLGAAILAARALGWEERLAAWTREIALEEPG